MTDKVADRFSDTASDIFDIFSDEYQRIKDKISGKKNKTLQAIEDEDFSDEIDEGHDDEMKYTNETDDNWDDFEDNLDHFEEEAKNAVGF